VAGKKSVRKLLTRRSTTILFCGTVLLAAAILMGGCVQIIGLQLNGEIAAGSNHTITLEASTTVPSGGPVRIVVAVRLPSAWEVVSASLIGPEMIDVFSDSTIMESVYASEWEAVAVGPGHNGPKDGYDWWVGYSEAHDWDKGEAGRVSITVDTHGRGGTYLIDLATGLAGDVAPEDLADRSLWQIGSAGLNPSGVFLDQPITLYCFTDVPPRAEYYEAIQGMGAAGLIGGYPFGSGGYREFRPLNPVLRAQYAKMVVGALNLGINENMAAPVDFRDLGGDTPDNLYPHEYVWTAYSYGIIKGYSDKTFRPYTPITRGHAVTMTVRALQKLHPGLLEQVPADFVQTWGKDLLPEHSANARIAEYNDLLTGLPLTTAASSGNAPMSRGEVAQLLWNMMVLLDQ
jgi:S-layer homology domain